MKCFCRKTVDGPKQAHCASSVLAEPVLPLEGRTRPQASRSQHSTDQVPGTVFKHCFNKLCVPNQRVLKAEEKSIMRLSLNNYVKTWI